uniref:Uncharacterized protein n=1 Tax=Oryza rufipogon TaxID=4529 RepID=A0A0E0PB23_ORYRU
MTSRRFPSLGPGGESTSCRKGRRQLRAAGGSRGRGLEGAEAAASDRQATRAVGRGAKRRRDPPSPLPHRRGGTELEHTCAAAASPFPFPVRSPLTGSPSSSHAAANRPPPRAAVRCQPHTPAPASLPPPPSSTASSAARSASASADCMTG